MTCIKLLYANINSYHPKSHLIGNYITENHIRCAMFVETKLKSSITFRNWTSIQKHGNIINRGVRGGALAMGHPMIQLGKSNPPAINSPSNNALHFCITIGSNLIHVFLIYIHPFSKIEESIFNMASLHDNCLIIGDFNPNPTKKKHIRQFLNMSNFVQITTSPTYVMEHNPNSTPDLLFCTRNIRNLITQVEVVPDLCSDHLSILIHVNSTSKVPKPIPMVTKNYNLCNVKTVNSAMKDYIEKNPTITVDTISTFNKRLKESIDKASPSITAKHYNFPLPPFIIRLIKEKRRLYRDFRVYEVPELKKQFNELNKKIQKLVKQYRTEKYMEACDTINLCKGKNYWHEVRKLSRYQKTPGTEELVDPTDGRVHSNPEKIVNIHADYLEGVYTFTEDVSFCPHSKNIIDDWYESAFLKPFETPEDALMSEEEYFCLLGQGSNTVPGYDNVTRKLLRSLDLYIHNFIREIINFCLTSQHFPHDWKTSIIICIPKKDSSLSDPANYRPISLLPVIGKIFETHLKNKLMSAVSEKIPPYQFGFQSGKSTSHPLTILVSNFQAARHEKLKSAAVFLDVRKAFDSVWHKGLLFKLHKLKTPYYLLNLLKQFLSNRSSMVKFKNHFSHCFSAQQGLPQGSPISPSLYNLFCHDVYNDHPDAFNLTAYALLYADDTALVSHSRDVASSIRKLQTLVNETESWFRKWRILINPTKTQFFIPFLPLSAPSPTIIIQSTAISVTPTCNYLGITLDRTLKFFTHATKVKMKVNIRAKHFKSLSFGGRGISTSCASHIYKTICRPIIEYGAILLNDAPRKTKYHLEVAERSALRSITRIRNPRNPLFNPSNQLLYQLTDILPIDTRLQRLSDKYFINLPIKALQHMLISPPILHPINNPTFLFQKLLAVRED